MALVADYGSESEDEEMKEEEEQESGSVVFLNSDTTIESTSATDQISDDEIDDNFQSKQDQLTKKIKGNGEFSKSSISSVFATLPESKLNFKTKISAENDKLEDFIPTVKSIKENQKEKKVKITIPSLSEFSDLNDEPEAKKIKPSPKGSGLLGILPPVKSAPLSNTTFVPNTVKSKNIPQNKATPSSAMIPHALKKKMEAQKVSAAQKLLQKYDSDSDVSDTEESFSKIPETYDDKLWESICARPSKPKDIIVDEPMEEEKPVNIAPEPPRAMGGLDNKAFKELVGKTKKPIGNIKIIDINEEEILPDKDVWMTKALTDPELAPRPSNSEDPVDPTRRRKHHITYLAQQAKAKEQELKTAWAAGRNNRMMSRSKYGF